MFNLVFRYAIKHDIVDKNYTELCNPVKVKKKNVKIPFTLEEVKKLWDIVDQVLFVDMILIGIYTGFRPIELVTIKTENINFDEGYIIGGTKTKDVKDRIVPIHPKIDNLIRNRFNKDNEYLFNVYNKITGKTSLLTYDKYRVRLKKSYDSSIYGS